ncbi:MAG: ABC transporter substrate-binding protein [Treponema sp.]|nr:ABC transporter substrate-binding protein [Treponema sp.]MCL2250771.1 ABC transporter substrate-binding protein [Treponema sp.]
MRFSVIILLAALFISCYAKQNQGLTITEGVLSVGVEIGYPPMEYFDVDGVTPIGFDIELTKALAEKLGLKVNYIDTAWEGILAGLDAKRYDIAVNITILEERQKKFNFTKPYIDSSMTIAALKDSQIKIDKPQDIIGLRIAYQGDTTAQFFTEKLKNQGLIFTSFSYDKITNCFDDLLLGRVDLIAADNIVTFNYAQKTDGVFEVIWQGSSDEYIGIALKKGNDALTLALNNALEELFKNGTMLEISLNIFNSDLVSSVKY